jgi:maltose O-acetyltransferase
MEYPAPELPTEPSTHNCREMLPLSIRDTPRVNQDASRLHLRLLIAQLLVGLLPSFFANRLRILVLRAAGFRIGQGTILWGMPTIIGSGNIQELLSIGHDCGFNVGCFLDLHAPITIGNHVGIGHDVLILTSTYEVGPGRQRAGMLVHAPVVIEDGAWVGARCTIMPGVTIGAGSVIGATMVVSNDVPPNTLLIGPQKISLAKWRL